MMANFTIAKTENDAFVAKYAALARSRTGLTDESLVKILDCQFAQLINVDYSFQSRSGGTSSVQQNSQVRIVGGSTSQGGIVRAGMIGSLMSLQQAKRFLAVCQWTIATNMPNANSRIYFQVGTTTVCAVACGFNGTISTASYGFCCNNTVSSAPGINVASTIVPFVGRRETGVIWYDGDYTWGAINGETPVQIADASKMVATVVQDFYFDSFPAASGQTDAVDIKRMTIWGET